MDATAAIIYQPYILAAEVIESRSCKMLSNCLQIVDSPWLCVRGASWQDTRNVYQVSLLNFRQFWTLHLRFRRGSTEVAEEHFNFTWITAIYYLSTKPLVAIRCLSFLLMWGNHVSGMEGMISEQELSKKRMNLHLQKINLLAGLEGANQARSVSQPYFKHLRAWPFISLFQIKYFDLILRHSVTVHASLAKQCSILTFK